MKTAMKTATRKKLLWITAILLVLGSIGAYVVYRVAFRVDPEFAAEQNQQNRQWDDLEQELEAQAP